MVSRCLSALALLVGCNAQFKATGFGANEPEPAPSAAAPDAAPTQQQAAATPSGAARASAAPSAEPVRETRKTSTKYGQIAASWKTNAPAACRYTYNYSPCDEYPDDVTEPLIAQCREDCKKQIADAFERQFCANFETCLEHYVDGEKDKASCAPVSLPKGADPAGNGAGWSEKQQADADALCTKGCREYGPKAVANAKEQAKLAKEGKSIVMAYKRCMLAVDATPTAIRYRVHDQDLYDDLMERTHAQCSKKHRCDQLEDPEACSFGN